MVKISDVMGISVEHITDNEFYVSGHIKGFRKEIICKARFETNLPPEFLNFKKLNCYNKALNVLCLKLDRELRQEFKDLCKSGIIPLIDMHLIIDEAADEIDIEEVHSL